MPVASLQTKRPLHQPLRSVIGFGPWMLPKPLRRSGPLAATRRGCTSGGERQTPANFSFFAYCGQAPTPFSLAPQNVGIQGHDLPLLVRSRRSLLALDLMC